MKFGRPEFRKIKGLNRRMLAVDPIQISFFEEHEIDGTIVTNIHLGTGKWVTAGVTLDEAVAVFSEDIIDKHPDVTALEAKEDQVRLNKWRSHAKARAEIQKEVNEALALIGPQLRSKSYHKETLPDGSGRMVIEYEPRNPSEPEDTD